MVYTYVEINKNWKLIYFTFAVIGTAMGVKACLHCLSFFYPLPHYHRFHLQLLVTSVLNSYPYPFQD